MRDSAYFVSSCEFGLGEKNHFVSHEDTKTTKVKIRYNSRKNRQNSSPSPLREGRCNFPYLSKSASTKSVDPMIARKSATSHPRHKSGMA